MHVFTRDNWTLHMGHMHVKKNRKETQNAFDNARCARVSWCATPKVWHASKPNALFRKCQSHWRKSLSEKVNGFGNAVSDMSMLIMIIALMLILTITLKTMWRQTCFSRCEHNGYTMKMAHKRGDKQHGCIDRAADRSWKHTNSQTHQRTCMHIDVFR